MKKIFIIFCIFLCVLGLFGLGYFTYQSKFVQQNRFYRAWQYEQMAKKFPPTSEMHLRLKAMADALRHNQKTYSYETNQMPFPQGAPPNIGQ